MGSAYSMISTESCGLENFMLGLWLKFCPGRISSERPEDFSAYRYIYWISEFTTWESSSTSIFGILSSSFGIIMKNVKVEPIRGTNFTWTLPSNSSTMCLQMIRPSPIPWVSIWWVLLKKPNILNNFSWSSLLIPIPVSWTWTSNLSFRMVTVMLIRPELLVNFKALDSRFRNTCWILFLSKMHWYGWL